MKKIAADRNYRMFKMAYPGPKGIEVRSIEEAAKYHVDKAKAAVGNPPDLKIDTGKSQSKPGAMYMTLLSSAERIPDYKISPGFGIDERSYDLIKGFKQDGGFYVSGPKYSGWQKPPSSWGYDPKWTVMENWMIIPYKADEK